MLTFCLFIVLNKLTNSLSWFVGAVWLEPMQGQKHGAWTLSVFLNSDLLRSLWDRKGKTVGYMEWICVPESPVSPAEETLLNEGWNINMNPEKIRGHSINPCLYIILSGSSGQWGKKLIDHIGNLPWQNSLVITGKASYHMWWEKKRKKRPFPLAKMNQVNVISCQMFSWEINSAFTIMSEREWVCVCVWMTFREVTSAWFCRENLCPTSAGKKDGLMSLLSEFL